ncbi:hypothetical protein [Pseudomonas baetica]|uniref:hypothetical protein n=1 Tax=Pseudomonas baetica TaxID=674054 RepID=UPI0024052F6E|nr:hypothetical protein [Pseudomonas baetica]MDF9779200.1 hypothetical protein [Pseudomonas baetica]
MGAMMMHSAQSYTDGWTSFLRVQSSNTGITFIIGENVPPATNGKTVWMPSMPVNLTKKDLVLFKSDGLHEIGHIRWSDIPYFQAFGAQHGQFAGFLLNAVDDVFMENKQSRMTREAEGYFRESAEIMFERKQFRDGSASPAEAVGSYTLCYLFSRAWSEYNAPLAVVKENFDKHFGEHAENVRSNLDQILYNEFPSVQSTRHAGALTLRIMAMLKALSDEDEKKKEEEKNGQQPKDQSGEQSPNGDSGKGQGGGKSEEKKPEQSGGSSDREPEEKKPEQSDGNSEGKPGEKGGQGDQQGNSQPQGGEKPGEGSKACNGNGDAAGSQTDGNQGAGAPGTSLKEIVDGIISANDLGDREVFDKRAVIQGISDSVAAQKNPDYKGQTLAPKCVIEGNANAKPSGKGFGGGAGKREVVDGIAVCPENTTEARVVESKLGRKVQVLATKLQSYLMNQEEADEFSTHRGGLGQNHLYRLGLGDTRIFAQKEEVERPTAAMSIVVDLSGSTMDLEDVDYVDEKNGKPKKKRRTNSLPSLAVKGNAVAGAASKEKAVEVPSIARSIVQAALIFEKVLNQIGTPREILGFAPSKGELMTMVRSFGDDHLTAVKRIGGLRGIAGGNHTPIGEAVFHAGRRLMAHDAQKKVLLVLTDGSPSCVDKAVEMTRFCESAGIRVVYLVIGETVRTDWLITAKIPFACAKTADEVGPVLIAEAKKLLM